MKRYTILVLLFLTAVFAHLDVKACTIVAVSGSITADGRPLLLKTRDGSNNDIKIKIGRGSKYVYLCQSGISGGVAYSGYNSRGFSIVNSHSYNMPNSDYGWNARIMQLALERCASVDEFDHFLDSLPKPISVCSNYGVIDTQGKAAIFEVNAYDYARFDADSTDCGYLIRANFSFSQDTTSVSSVSPSSIPRYLISAAYLEDALITDGYLTKDHLIGLSRCLINADGEDLRDIAPIDENSYTPVDFRYYVPRAISTSAMVIQGVLPNEQPSKTVAWTMLGPQLTSVTIPYIITPQKSLPQKACLGPDGHSWLCQKGLALTDSCFVNNTILDLAKLYNQSQTGVLQKIVCMEDEIMRRGNELVNNLRAGHANAYNVAAYYSWVDNYLDYQYGQCLLNNSCDCDSWTDTIVAGDTTYIYVHDTIQLVDTVFFDHYIVDTIWMTDTIYIHDTIFVTPTKIDNGCTDQFLLYQRYGGMIVESAEGSALPQIAIYDVNGRLIDFHAACDEPKWYRIMPSSGIYLVKIGNCPAHKIVIVK